MELRAALGVSDRPSTFTLQACALAAYSLRYHAEEEEKKQAPSLIARAAALDHYINVREQGSMREQAENAFADDPAPENEWPEGWERIEPEPAALIPGGHACPIRGCWVHTPLERCSHCKPAAPAHGAHLVIDLGERAAKEGLAILGAHPAAGTILSQSVHGISGAKVADGKGGVRGALLNVTLRTSPCGCSITGDGTLQHPLEIEHCAKHSA